MRATTLGPSPASSAPRELVRSRRRFVSVGVWGCGAHLEALDPQPRVVHVHQLAHQLVDRDLHRGLEQELLVLRLLHTAGTTQQRASECVRRMSVTLTLHVRRDAPEIGGTSAPTHITWEVNDVGPEWRRVSERPH